MTSSERVEISPELLAAIIEAAQAVPFKAWASAQDDDGAHCVIAPDGQCEPWWILTAAMNVPGDTSGELAAAYAALASPAVVLALAERIRELERTNGELWTIVEECKAEQGLA